MSSDHFHPSWVGFFGDYEILSRYVWIIIHHYKDPYRQKAGFKVLWSLLVTVFMFRAGPQQPGKTIIFKMDKVLTLAASSQPFPSWWLVHQPI